MAKSGNERLKDENAAMELLAEQSSYLGSLIAKDDMHRSFIPSANIGRHPAETTALAFLESGWRGIESPKEWLRVWTYLQPNFILKVDIEFKDRLGKYVAAWTLASPADRKMLEKTMKNGLETRSTVGRVLAFSSPRNLLEFYRTTLPPTAANSRRQMSEIVNQLGLSDKQREELQIIWAKYSGEMSKAVSRVEVAKLTLCHALKAFDINRSVNMHEQAQKDIFLATYIQNVNSSLVNSTLVYHSLFEAFSRVITWRQRTALSLGMRPYTANVALCCELVCQ